MAKVVDRVDALGRVLLGCYAAAQLALLIYLFVDHARFPLFLDLMEGTVLQHVQRAASSQAIYSEPTPDFVPLAYNPLYYVLAVPFTWILGTTLPTLRLVASLGALVGLTIVFLVVRRRTGSTWWGVIAAGSLAAAYRVMVCYLDTAHSDSWLLAAALGGTYMIDRFRNRTARIAGLLILVASFWFKQHGAWFVLGGLAYLTWREGWRRSMVYWLVVVVLGPALYILAGNALFGPRFHFFTWDVPRRWTELSWHTLYVYFGFVAISYPILAVSAAWHSVRTWVSDRGAVNLWHVQFGAALLSGFMGALDPGCSFNVFIPMGTWFIMLGTIGLADWPRPGGRARRLRLHHLALAVSFGVLFYDPRTVVTSPRAGAAYGDLLGFLRGMDGPVYAPTLGQLPEGFELHPAAHWVALEDLVRGPGRNTRKQPIVRELVVPALTPDGPAYILENQPLEQRRHFLEFLSERYVLQADLGDRFRPLAVLPGRYDHGWPRYLYRHVDRGRD